MNELLTEMEKYKQDKCACMCSARNWIGRERNCDKNICMIVYILGIKVTKTNLEKDFILIDTFWIIYYILSL